MDTAAPTSRAPATRTAEAPARTIRFTMDLLEDLAVLVPRIAGRTTRGQRARRTLVYGSRCRRHVHSLRPMTVRPWLGDTHSHGRASEHAEDEEQGKSDGNSDGLQGGTPVHFTRTPYAALSSPGCHLHDKRDSLSPHLKNRPLWTRSEAGRSALTPQAEGKALTLLKNRLTYAEIGVELKVHPNTASRHSACSLESQRRATGASRIHHTGRVRRLLRRSCGAWWVRSEP